MTKFKRGDRAILRYSGTLDADYIERSGKAVIVLRLLNSSEADDEVGPMYEIAMGDIPSMWRGQVFEDELETISYD